MVRFVDPGFHENCSLSRFLEGESDVFSETIEGHDVKPCKSEKGEYLIESNLVNRLGVEGLDEGALEFIFDSNSERFSDIKNSEDLGVFDIDWERHKIKVYSSGKIEVRQGSSKEEMKKILENIEKLMIVSLKCGNCDRILLECIGRRGAACFDDSVPSGIELDDYFLPIMENSLEYLIDIYKNCLESDFSSSSLAKDINMDKYMDKFHDAFGRTSSLIINSTEKESILAGWSVQSLIFDNFRFLEQFNYFLEKGILDERMKYILKKYFSISKRIVLLYEGTEVRIQKLIRSSKELEEDWNDFRAGLDMRKFEDEFNFIENMISSNIFRLKDLEKVYFK